MATNICSKSRSHYITVKELAEELNCSKAQIYHILKRPEMKEAFIKIGSVGIRIKKDTFYLILEQIYR